MGPVSVADNAFKGIITEQLFHIHPPLKGLPAFKDTGLFDAREGMVQPFQLKIRKSLPLSAFLKNDIIILQPCFRGNRLGVGIGRKIDQIIKFTVQKYQRDPLSGCQQPDLFRHSQTYRIAEHGPFHIIPQISPVIIIAAVLHGNTVIIKIFFWPDLPLSEKIIDITVLIFVIGITSLTVQGKG